MLRGRLNSGGDPGNPAPFSATASTGETPSVPREEPQPAPSGEALEALKRLTITARGWHDGDFSHAQIDKDYELLWWALSGLPQPGQMHPVDRAFYKHTVLQRDAAWREIETLKAQIAQLQGSR